MLQERNPSVAHTTHLLDLHSLGSCCRQTAKRKTLASHLHVEICVLIFSFPLDFLLEKFKFPTQTDALLFPGRSGFRAASSGVNLLGGFTLSVKTLCRDEAAEHHSPPASASSTTLISQNKYPQKTSVLPTVSP